jgi:hypothetical protein
MPPRRIGHGSDSFTVLSLTSLMSRHFICPRENEKHISTMPVPVLSAVQRYYVVDTDFTGTYRL